MTEQIAFKDGFTADGRLKPGPSVTKAKVAKVKSLMEAALIRGDVIANATLQESLSTSDAIFSAAFLANLQFLPQFLALPRTWSQVAGVRVVPNFDPITLRGLFGTFEGLERGGSTASETTGPANPAGIAPVVAELESYPYATIGDVESAYGKINKHGFKVGLSWEDQVNGRGAEFFSQLPSEMLNVALDTENWEVWHALIAGTAAGNQLAAGTIFTGAAVLDNAALSRNAIILAIQQLTRRQINGRYIGASSNGYNLIVPIGTGPSAQFLLNQQIVQATDGSFTLSVEDAAGLGAVTVVESEYVTGTNWYLMAKPGGYRRPVLELGRLRGHEVPELRVENATGSYIGGATVSPFEGSFANDAVDMRLRIPISGILWDDTFVVWSQGDNVA